MISNSCPQKYWMVGEPINNRKGEEKQPFARAVLTAVLIGCCT
jgi:hypothetical protein